MGELRLTKISRVFRRAQRGTTLARGEGEFPPRGPRDPRPTLMAFFGLFLGISLLLQGVMTSRDARL